MYKRSMETARRLKKEYTIALGILVIMLLLSQAAVQYTIHLNISDSRIVNIAGRQRMLSQRINKAVLGLIYCASAEDHAYYTRELDTSLQLWVRSHNGLLNGDKALGLPGDNSPTIKSMFQVIEPHYEAMVAAANDIRSIVKENHDYEHEELLPYIEVIRRNEEDFLKGMDDIVFQYDKESKQKISNIRVIEIAITIIAFFVIGMEVMFIFIPALRHVRNAIGQVEAGKELLDATMSAIGSAIIVTDNKGKITLMNPMAEKYTGWSSVEAHGKDSNIVFNNRNVHTKERDVDPVAYVLETGQTSETPKFESLLSRNGNEIRISGNTTGIYSENGEITGVVISVRDVSKEHELEREVEAFLEVNLDIFCVAEKDGRFHRVNKRFEEILGYRADEVEGKDFLDFVHEEDNEATKSAFKQLEENKSLSGFTNRYRCKDGSYKYLEWHSTLGIGKYIYSSARDVTEQKRIEEQLKKIAIRDELTGLYNRHYFEQIINEEMERADRYDQPLSIMLLDLDHFKKVNDTWGHPVGDELLKLTSETMSKTVRYSDILIRFGGEEFVVLLPHTSIEGAAAAAEKVRAGIEKNSHPVTGTQTVSIGIAERMKSESFRHLYKRTDDALYRAKQEGRNRVIAAGCEERETKAYVKLAWRQEWESGNSDIDIQHRELLDMVDHLIEISLAGNGYGETIEQVDKLLKHVAFHFDFEENVLKEVEYPELEEHIESHRVLVAKAMQLENSYRKGEIKSSAFFSYLVDDVILGHMIDEDSKYFPSLKDKL
ncbi:MAG TPA: diguanylate cyclase [Negativicutes bacterium]|nr:diguanylate cyclase [Negativicutes bacterium]